LKTTVGSKVYMAPEVVEGRPHSYPCDMWSIGVILYVMLSGRFPFMSKNVEHDICEVAHAFPKGIWG
jgi:serine/threonine protein kinase